MLFSLANAVEAKDRYTQGHTTRVATTAMNLGRRMGLEERELEARRIGGILHDIGKIGVPDVILNKPGPLDHREREIMKTALRYRTEDLPSPGQNPWAGTGGDPVSP